MVAEAAVAATEGLMAACTTAYNHNTHDTVPLIMKAMTIGVGRRQLERVHVHILPYYLGGGGNWKRERRGGFDQRHDSESIGCSNDAAVMLDLIEPVEDTNTGKGRSILKK